MTKWHDYLNSEGKAPPWPYPVDYDKEREIVELRFGLDRDGEMRTLQEIGDALHLSRERIRQIEARAKEKLRRSKRANELRSYLN